MIFAFFATKDDLCSLLEWMDSTGDYVFLEKDSEPDQPNRIYEHFPKAEFLAEENMVVSAWVKAAGGRPIARKVQFMPEVRKATKTSGRTILESPAIFRFHPFQGLKDGFIGPVEFFYETEISTRKGYQYDHKLIEQTNWEALKAATEVLKRQIKKTSAGKWKSRPVLPGVAEQLSSGSAKLWYWGDEGTI